MKPGIVLILFLLVGISGCALQEEPSFHMDSNRVYFSCKGSADTRNVKYLGEYRGAENNVSVAEMTRDLACSEKFKSDLGLIGGYVTIMGGSKFGKPEDELKCKDGADCKNKKAEKEQRDKLYRAVQEFSRAWTGNYGDKYPIMTGGGPGLMEAGSRGAKEYISRSSDTSRRHSIGYTTYYTPFDIKNPRCGKGPRCADPALVMQKHDGNDIITDGIVFTSVAVRESQMIRHSSAILIGPGGTGTEWEVYQILETIKSAQLRAVPIFLIGSKEKYWETLISRLKQMKDRGFVSPGDIEYDVSGCNGFTKSEVPEIKGCGKVNFEFVENPMDVLEKLSNHLKVQ
ncbi:LOG family protein [Pseudomonas peradeniyensis]|uniref:AMP nucleosidase n=1 Tax=Pseudomonas peradeniyensis TaxID=2745488 RepID=A0ABT2V6Q5_9PSED|nr:LOG family protein [Pseudomonas peradeniyensis]MCU7237353.1 LOG family protein [Pseudomonas peradeniyensis]